MASQSPPAAMKAAQDSPAEREFHNAMLGVKEQVISKYKQRRLRYEDAFYDPCSKLP
jgi:hypothetical protein